MSQQPSINYQTQLTIIDQRLLKVRGYPSSYLSVIILWRDTTIGTALYCKRGTATRETLS